MKTAFELFNWYFDKHEKSKRKGVQPYRLDAVDLEICLKEYDRELRKATSDSMAEFKERIDFLETRFRHYHVNNHENDACKQCGLDLRDKVHCRA